MLFLELDALTWLDVIFLFISRWLSSKEKDIRFPLLVLGALSTLSYDCLLSLEPRRSPDDPGRSTEGRRAEDELDAAAGSERSCTASLTSSRASIHCNAVAI